MNGKSQPRSRWHSFFVILLSLMLTAMLAFSPLTQAANILVTTTADELNNNGTCSLREAIANANADNQSGSLDCAAGTGNDTITFITSGTITLGSELEISDAAGLTISGPASGITVSGNNATRVFLLVSPSVKVTLENLTIANGNGPSGGGIFSNGTLTASRCTFLNNTSSGGYASSGGGAISTNGTLTVLDSTFSGNSAAIGGGGIRSTGTLTVTSTTFSGNAAAAGGGVLNYGSAGVAEVSQSTFTANTATDSGGGIENLGATLALTNCTFSDNSAGNNGGGIYNYNTAATLNVTNSTFSDNSATTGGGVRNNAGTTTLRNSIVAKSTAGNNCIGTIINGGNNIDDGTSCGWGSNNGSLSSTNPQLDPLANNGGPTQTMKLLNGSPAIDQGNDAVCAAAPVNNKDQRGVTRPQGTHCDIGAFEYGAILPRLYLPLIIRN